LPASGRLVHDENARQRMLCMARLGRVAFATLRLQRRGDRMRFRDTNRISRFRAGLRS
jgi:hypothetical protein